MAKKKGVEMAWGRRFAQPPAWADSRLYVTKQGLRKPELRRRETMGARVIMCDNPKPPPGEKPPVCRDCVSFSCAPSV